MPNIGFFDDISIQFLNPKAYAVALALFSGFPFHEQSFTAETTLKFLIFNTIWIPAHLVWLYIAITLNAMNFTQKKKRVLNLILATMMVCAVTFSVVILFIHPK